MAGSMTGLVLAGGQASRMRDAGADAPPLQDGQDVDKGLLNLHEQPLVAHACAFLRPWVAHMLISANRHAERYGTYGEVIGDDAGLGCSLGPLAGVERALAVMQTPWLLVLPVDVVNLPPDLVQQLTCAIENPAVRIAYACTPTHAHPLGMVLHASLWSDLRRYLQEGGRKVRVWLAQQGAAPVSFQGADLFFNINTPADLCYANQCFRS